MITQSDLTSLRAAKIANPHWFKAIKYCADVMVPRRKKYSGDKHSYFNFVDMAKRTGLTMGQVFLFYINIKLSRLGVGSIEKIVPLGIGAENGKQFITVNVYYEDEPESDFEDDPKRDSWADSVNYAALALGALLDQISEKDVENYEAPDPNEHPYDWPTILVDFDGVLNMYGDPEHGGGWKGYFRHYPMRPGADKFVAELKRRGACIVIHTVRPDIEETWKWLKENGIAEYITDVTNIKPAGVVLLDDRALTFTGDFDKALEDIRLFKTHWEPGEIVHVE